MHIWFLVAVLLTALLALHGYYLRRDYRMLLRHWQNIDQALRLRHNLVQEIAALNPALNQAIGQELNLLLQQTDERHPKRWLQRAAMESRLSIRLEHALRQTPITAEQRKRLNHADSSIQLSLELYQIVAGRFNSRCTTFPGNLLAGIMGLVKAPDFEISGCGAFH